MVVRADSPDAFLLLARVLAGGGVAIAPGDTMYGMLGIAPDSESRIRRVKGRGEDKPFLRLLHDSAWVAKVSDMPVPERLSDYWPGPLTMVFPDRAGGTIALRVPDSHFLRTLLEAVGKPLFSTSVNRAGVAPLPTIDAMRREFEGDVDLIYDAGDILPGPPSTLVDVTARPFKVLRQGALSLGPDDLV
jgi:L-threonylcarbamoyladenylate synthase